jgi:hypothetical protein
MLTKLSKWLHKMAKGWIILLIIGLFVVFVNLPVADPDLISKSLDGQFGYSPEQAFSAIKTYGEDGREQMVWIHFADFILIIVYTSMFCLAISWLFQRSFDPESKAQRMNLVPLLGGLFDVMENIWITILLVAHPAEPKFVAWLATIFTTGKYILGIPIFLLLIIGIVRFLTIKLKRSNNEKWKKNICDCGPTQHQPDTAYAVR